MAKYTNHQARESIQDRISITERTWANVRDLRNEIYSLYRFWNNVEPEVTLGERSNIFIPLAFSIVETKLPRVVQALLGLDPFFKVEGRQGRDQANARFMSDVMRFQFNDELNAFNTLAMWWKEALIYGNSYMFVGWERETAKLKKRIPRTFAGTEIIGHEFGTSEEVVYDGISLNHLDLFNCFPAPYGTRINGSRFERMPYFIVRSEPSAEYLKALSNRKDQNGEPILDKKAVDDILKRFPQGTGDISDAERDRLSYNRINKTENIDKYAPKYVMWTMFEQDWWVSMINTTVVRNKPNPYGDNKIPIVQAFDTPVPHEHVSIGQIEPIIKLNYYANDIENLKLDFLIKAINPGKLISQAELLDPAKFQQDPGGIHLVRNNPNNAIALVHNPNPNIIRSTEEQINIERLMDKTLGQSDVSRGVSRPGKDTATEVVSLIEQANFRFDLSIRFLKHESLVPLLDMIAERNMMFWPFEKEIKAYTESGDPQFMNVPVSRLIGNYRFKMITNPAQGNKFAYAQTLIRFLDVINASGGQNPGLVREIAKFLQIDNIDELLDNPARDALMVIVQAAQEGLLSNPRQASLVLAEVLNQLAPPGSEAAKAVGGGAGGGGGAQPARDERDVASQVGQELR